MRKDILRLSSLFFVFLSTNIYATEHAVNNLAIKAEKKEVVVIDGKEIIYPTTTLKPVMILEESIFLTNKSRIDTQINTIYDFKLDKKSSFYGEVKQKEKDVNVLYSDDNGSTFSSYPLTKNGNEVSKDDYTTIRFIIKKIEPLEKKELIVRYTYNHFK